jgi:competence protein ComEC
LRLISFGIAWLTGIWAGSFWHLSWVWMLAGLLPAVLGLFFKDRRRALIHLALVSLIFFGGLAYYPASLPGDVIQPGINGPATIEITGRISAPPETKDKTTQLVLTVTRLNSQTDTGRVLLYAGRYPEYHYGDLLKVKGVLEAPPRFAGFDYQAYLAREGIYAVVLAPDIELVEARSGFSFLGWTYDLRQRLSDSLARVLPEPQAGLAQGILLGIRSTLSPDLRDQLALTGTAHLIAISGINLTIIAGMVLALGLRLFGRRHYYYIWLSLAVVWFYSFLSGLQAPVLRAAIMASVFLFAELLGRQKWATPALIASAAIMVGIDPQLLWSVSFQLSFLAMAGLIFISPVLQKPVENFVSNRWGEEGWAARLILPVTDSFAVSLGAILAIGPVMVANFGVFSLVGPLTTFLISPAITPIIFLGSLTAFVGLLNLTAAWIIGWTAWLFLGYMLGIIGLFAHFPLAAVPAGGFSLTGAKVYYLVLGLGLSAAAHVDKLKQAGSQIRNRLSQADRFLTRFPWKYVVVPLLLGAIFITLAAGTLPDTRMKVSFLDVGEGDAVLIQSSGTNILVDGGPSPQAVCRELGAILPFWDRRIDLLVLTHPHLDHLSGLVEVLRRYQIGQILTTDLFNDTPPFEEWLSLIREKQLLTTSALSGQKINLADGTQIEVLNPGQEIMTADSEKLERQGIVLKASRGKYSFLLTADIDESTELQMLKSRVDVGCTVLKAAHHGSSTSTSLEFLSVAQPRYAVISCGRGNKFGHPSTEVLERLQNTGVYRTDTGGTIEFTTDGQQLWVKSAR